MDNNLRDKKPPELCQIMITYVQQTIDLVKEIRKDQKEWHKQRWQAWTWLIPTALIAIALFIDVF